MVRLVSQFSCCLCRDVCEGVFCSAVIGQSCGEWCYNCQSSTNWKLDWSDSITDDVGEFILPRDAVYKRGPCRRAVCGVCPSVRPSVCLSVCPSRSCILWKRVNILSDIFHCLVDKIHHSSFFPHQTSWRYSDGDPGASNAAGVWKIAISTNLWLYLGAPLFDFYVTIMWPIVRRHPCLVNVVGE